MTDPILLLLTSYFPFSVSPQWIIILCAWFSLGFMTSTMRTLSCDGRVSECAQHALRVYSQAMVYIPVKIWSAVLCWLNICTGCCSKIVGFIEIMHAGFKPWLMHMLMFSMTVKTMRNINMTYFWPNVFTLADLWNHQLFSVNFNSVINISQPLITADSIVFEKGFGFDSVLILWLEPFLYFIKRKMPTLQGQTAVLGKSLFLKHL